MLALLLLLAVLAWWRVWITGHPTSSITCACGDPSQELWLFAWIPYALSHGINPLFTHLLEAGQGGVNMMWDANNPLASLVLSPVTVLFGPIASFNVAALVAPVLSGWCFFVAVRRVTRFVPGQIAGAVLYGFSPFVIWNGGYGHINLTWLFFPPLVFLLLHDLFLVPTRRPEVIGRWLGVLVVVQFFSGTEVLVLTIIGVAIAGAIAVAIAPQAAWALRRRIGAAAGWAAGISVCLLAYPAWYTARGPRHIVGSPWPSLDLVSHGVAASTLFLADSSLSQASAVTRRFGYFGAQGPSLLFVGFALLLFLGVSAIVWHRDYLAWVMVGLGSAATLLSLTFPGIWRLFGHVPVFEDIEPSRFAILAGFAAAVLLAISADLWWQRATRPSTQETAGRSHPWLTSSSAVWGAVITLALGCVLWTVAGAYVLPYVVHSDAEPAWFTRDAPHLAAGTRVLVLPTDFQTVTNVMSWQAEANFPFALEGGYAIAPGADSHFQYSMPPVGAAGILDHLSSGKREPLSLAPTVRSALKRWGVGVAVMNERVADPEDMKAFFTQVVGQAPRSVGGLWVWTAKASGISRNGQPRSASPGSEHAPAERSSP